MASAHAAHVCRTQEQAGFHLAWCYEMCRKADHSDTLGELQCIAARFGSKLFLHKKSTGFLAWLGKAEKSVFLLADWREAKPVVEGFGGLDRLTAQQSQLRMCILAQSDQSFQRATEWTARVRSSHGIDILVLDGFSHKGVEDFIARSLDETSSCAGGDMDADSTRAVSEDLAMDNSFNGYAFGLSLPRILRAVQDPEQAARLEQTIKGTMWQLYED
ncbi:unnamed protein product [Symbiodinium natans]|uniref:Uncharacterized protein n=1 Tax=Symbiodinium natans TaxID=878477 RepID=A0A812Q0W4_9DINO|nr:unnamed protein product [Symbiodinium natans]